MGYEEYCGECDDITEQKRVHSLSERALITECTTCGERGVHTPQNSATGEETERWCDNCDNETLHLIIRDLGGGRIVTECKVCSSRTPREKHRA